MDWPWLYPSACAILQIVIEFMSYLRTAATKQKNREASLRFWADPSKRAEMLAAFHKRGPEWRENVRKGVSKALQEHPDIRQRMSEAARGHKRWLGRKHRPETIEKMRRIMKNRIPYERSAETRAKVSAASKRSWANPQYRENMLRVARNRSPQTREKQRRNRLSQNFSPSPLETILHEAFTREGLSFEPQKAMFSRFQCDFVFVEAQLIVEADGDYWHRRRYERKDGRDRLYAAAAEEGWAVWRFAESEITTNPAACARSVVNFIRNH